MDKTDTMMRESNYEIMKKRMEKEFIKYDQQSMIRKFFLKFDSQYLYIPFVGSLYRVDRHIGKVERQESADDFREAGYNEAMTIFDVLCNSKENCCLANAFTAINSLPGTVYGAAPGTDFFQDTAQYFDGRSKALACACERLGGTKEGIGDVSYRLPIFDFLPVQLRFWESDDEFGASLQLLWDKNILDYMHYETTFFATGYLLEKIQSMMQGLS